VLVKSKWMTTASSMPRSLFPEVSVSAWARAAESAVTVMVSNGGGVACEVLFAPAVRPLPETPVGGTDQVLIPKP